MASAATAKPPLDMGLRTRLSIMMFLQFAIWGSWATVIGNYLKYMKFDESVIGWVGSLMPLGAILAPLLVSQLADRYVASEKLMAVLHLGVSQVVNAPEELAQFSLIFDGCLDVVLFAVKIAAGD